MDDHKYGIILEMRELVSKGMVMKVVEEINAADPIFFAQNPILLFRFKQVIYSWYPFIDLLFISNIIQQVL